MNGYSFEEDTTLQYLLNSMIQRRGVVVICGLYHVWCNCFAVACHAIVSLVLELTQSTWA